MNNRLKLFLTRVFKIDPSLTDATQRTERLTATLNGDAKWMLTCTLKAKDKIQCDDGYTYRKEPTE